MRLMELYEMLLDTYGPRGWWPLISLTGKGGRDERGYLPGGPAPSDRNAAFEVAVGAVLTQNTAWTGAERAVKRLFEADLLTPRAILSSRPENLADLVRPAGCFHVKTRKLIELADFFESLQREGPGYRPPDRKRLLSIWGIGPETADSILLYAFGIPSFVIDEYSRRIFRRLGMEVPLDSYDALKSTLERVIPASRNIYSEYHALLVEHAKTVCKALPLCDACTVRKVCGYRMSTLW